ncbi:unnamed protein product, partial [Nesidiocoris tenuis]
MTSDRIRSAIKCICYARKRPRRFVFLDNLSRLSIGIREEIGYYMHYRYSGEYHQRSAVPAVKSTGTMWFSVTAVLFGDKAREIAMTAEWPGANKMKPQWSLNWWRGYERRKRNHFLNKCLCARLWGRLSEREQRKREELLCFLLIYVRDPVGCFLMPPKSIYRYMMLTGSSEEVAVGEKEVNFTAFHQMPCSFILQARRKSSSTVNHVLSNDTCHQSHVLVFAQSDIGLLDAVLADIFSAVFPSGVFLFIPAEEFSAACRYFKAIRFAVSGSRLGRYQSGNPIGEAAIQPRISLTQTLRDRENVLGIWEIYFQDCARVNGSRFSAYGPHPFAGTPDRPSDAHHRRGARDSIMGLSLSPLRRRHVLFGLILIFLPCTVFILISTP